MRAAQVGALGQYQRVAEQGLPLEERLAAENAQNQIMAANRRSNLSVLSDLAQRGRLGGGDELQARLLANQGQQNLSNSLGSDLARQAIANRLGATGQVAALSGQIRGQDIGLSSQNANIANQFNMLAANMRNEAAMRNAQERSRSLQANIAQNQRIHEMNQMGRYQSGLMGNQLKQQQFQNSMDKTALINQALGGLATGKYAKSAADAANINAASSGIGGVLGSVIGGIL